MTRAKVLVLFAVATSALPGVARAGTLGDGPVVNIGHRGASGWAPEHTIPAYNRALRHGADTIELDLRLTSDGVLVAMHDASLDRTARGWAKNCKRRVIGKTLAQIKTCDGGSWFIERYPNRARRRYVGLRIPTLQEVFARYGRRTSYHIELKMPGSSPGMEEKLLRLMEQYGLRDPAARTWRVLIQSFSQASLRKIHALDPGLPLVQMLNGRDTTIRESLPVYAEYAVGVALWKGDVRKSVVNEAHASCLMVYPYTVNRRRAMKRLIARGVDGIYTDFPDRLDRALGTAAGGRLRVLRAASDAHSACAA